MRGAEVEHMRAAARSLPAEGLSLEELLQRLPGTPLPWLIVLCTVAAAVPGAQLGWLCAPVLLVMAHALGRGQRHVRLPRRMAAARIGCANARRLLQALAWTAQALQRWCRPRALRIVRAQRRRPAARLVAAMAVVILLPLPGANVLPAVAVVLLMGGILRRDGYAILAAWATAVLSLAVAAAIVLLGWRLASGAL